MINFSLANISALCVHGGTTLNGGASVHSLINNYSTASDPFADTITVRQDDRRPGGRQGLPYHVSMAAAR